MKPAHIFTALTTLVQLRQPAFIWGPPGAGKSQIVAQVATALGYDLQDIRAILLDPVDLRGLPRITAEGTARWCAPGFLPDQGSESHGILFLDELNAAPPLVQAACYQLILDRRIGEYTLPDGWAVIAAGNRESDRAVTHRMPSALANRLVHIDFTVDLEDWVNWAQQHGIRREIIAFLRFRPRLLHDFDPKSSEKAFASPRSWAFFSKILDAGLDKLIEHQLCKGTIGSVAAAEFMGFLDIWRDLPSIEHILEAPSEAPVPHDPAAIYAICEALAEKATPESMPALAIYASRLPAEFGVFLMRDAVCSDERTVSTEAFARWAEANAHVLM